MDLTIYTLIYKSFVEHIPKNYPGVTFASNVRNSKGENTHLLIRQYGEEYKFKFSDDFKPYENIEHLRDLENKLFEQLKD